MKERGAVLFAVLVLSSVLVTVPNSGAVRANGSVDGTEKIQQINLYTFTERNDRSYDVQLEKSILPESPSQIMSFEEAVKFASKQSGRIWNTGGNTTGTYEGEAFVTADGLTTGHLCWYAGNGSIYEAVYPSGEVTGELVRLRSPPPSEAHYLWALLFMDASIAWIDARNGDLLYSLPGRFPGTLYKHAALNVINASQPRMELWHVKKYERIKSAALPLEEPASFLWLWRAANGSLYTIDYPLITDEEVVRIRVSNDIEEYRIWEVRTETGIYYIDARNGAIRLIISNDELLPQTQVTPSPIKANIIIAATILVVIVLALVNLRTFFQKKQQHQ